MKRTFAHILMLLAFITAAYADDTGGQKFEVRPGLVYSTADAISKMDLYLPQNATADVPCVLVIQGGGFRAQNGQKFKPFAEYLAAHGLAAALIGYRGQPDHTYPATLADLRTATRFVRKISAQHGIDPDKIGAMGRSAGATIAALLATSDSDDNDAGNEHLDFSSGIQAVVGIAGVYDFIARFVDEEQRALQPNVDTKILSNGAWIGTPFSAQDSHWRRASTVTHLDPSDPPMLLLHSRNDSTVPWPQSHNMHHALIDAGIKAQLHLADSGGHGGPSDSKERMVTFFTAVFAD